MDPGHSKEWKANPLVDRDKHIEQHHGQQDGVNERHAQHMAPFGREDIAQQPFFEPFLLRQHLLFKAHFVFFKVGLPLLSPFFGLCFNGRFKLLNTVQKLLDLGGS